jgi:hypothetical protein
VTDRKRLEIQVSQEDIDRGIREDSARCVVARAIARTIPDATRIEVDTQAIRFTSGGKRLIYLTPWTAQNYVVAFDAGDEIKPFEFRIGNPIEAKRKPYKPATIREVRDLSMTDNAIRQREAKKARRAKGPTVAAPASGPVARAVPRVFKARKRTYGHRVLRINKERESAQLGVS